MISSSMNYQMDKIEANPMLELFQNITSGMKSIQVIDLDQKNEEMFIKLNNLPIIIPMDFSETKFLTHLLRIYSFVKNY